MVLKKKFLGGLKLLLLLLFMLLFVSSYTVCRAEDERYIQLSISQVQSIVTELNMGNYYSGDYLYSWQNTFNQWMRTQEAQTDFDWTNYNILFYVGSGHQFISWTPVLRQSGQSSINPDLYIETLNSNSTVLYIRGFNGWNRDANNNITGTNYKSYYRYYIQNNNVNQVNYTIVSATNYTNLVIPTNSIDITRNSVGEYDCFIDRILLWEPHQFKGQVQRIAGRNTDIPTGYSYFWLTHSLGTGSGDPVPTSTPTPVPTGGGGFTDLTETNNLIGEVKDSIDDLEDTLTAVPSGDDFGTVTSGDIIDSLGFQLMEDPYDNFWYFFVTNLRIALLDSVRVYEIDFLGNHYYIDLDEIGFPIDNRVKASFRLFSVLIACWAILKLFKTSADMVQSANIDRILELNEEEGFIDFF